MMRSRVEMDGVSGGEGFRGEGAGLLSLAGFQTTILV